MPEFNSKISLLRQLTTEALGRSHEAKVFELRRMETMRECLNVSPEVGDALECSLEVLVSF
jgi:hypothetical protein